jgi:hypothetical protein
MILKCDDGVVRRFHIAVLDGDVMPGYFTRRQEGTQEAYCEECHTAFGIADTAVLKPRFIKHICGKKNFRVGQVVAFENMSGDIQYERVFAIGGCSKHPGTDWPRITQNGSETYDDDCGCLGDVKMARKLTAKEIGRR